MAREGGERAPSELVGCAAAPRIVGDSSLLDELLGHARRRYVCDALLLDSEWSLDDLATSITAWEKQIPEGEVSRAEREQVYVSLFHAHVPKLVERGMVSFDPVSETVSTTETGERVLRRLVPHRTRTCRE